MIAYQRTQYVELDWIDKELREGGIHITPQEQKVLNLMLRDGAVTRLTAMHYGIPNVTARISELRAKLEPMAYDILVDVKEDANGNEYGSWSLFDRIGVATLKYYDAELAQAA